MFSLTSSRSYKDRDFRLLVCGYGGGGYGYHGMAG